MGRRGADARRRAAPLRPPPERMALGGPWERYAISVLIAWTARAVRARAAITIRKPTPKRSGFLLIRVAHSERVGWLGIRWKVVARYGGALCRSCHRPRSCHTRTRTCMWWSARSPLRLRSSPRHSPAAGLCSQGAVEAPTSTNLLLQHRRHHSGGAVAPSRQFAV